MYKPQREAKWSPSDLLILAARCAAREYDLRVSRWLA